MTAEKGAGRTRLAQSQGRRSALYTVLDHATHARLGAVYRVGSRWYATTGPDLPPPPGRGTAFTTRRAAVAALVRISAINR